MGLQSTDKKDFFPLFMGSFKIVATILTELIGL